MLNKIFTGMVLGLIAISNISFASEKIYINEDDLDHKHESFHIHMGHNVWIETDTIHRDDSGLYTFENRLVRSKSLNGVKTEYKKKWKCPYCYIYWPLGTACQNEDCPSKYK